MTFEEWWKAQGNRLDDDETADALHAWDAATSAERARYAKLVDKVKYHRPLLPGTPGHVALCDELDAALAELEEKP